MQISFNFIDYYFLFICYRQNRMDKNFSILSNAFHPIKEKGIMRRWEDDQNISESCDN